MNLKILSQSFKNAFRGIAYTWQFEQSFRIEITIAILVLTGAFYFPLTRSEKLITILFITLVLILELINSVLERLVDLVSPKFAEPVKTVKDMMAGAVLLVSLASLLVGVIIFFTHFKNLFGF